MQAQSAVERLGTERGPLFPDKHGDPCSPWIALRWLHEAEEAAGVPHVKGRGYHGVKRRFVTGLLSETGDADLVGRVTGTSTTALIEQTYRQQSDDDLPRAAKLLDTTPTRKREKKRGGRR